MTLHRIDKADPSIKNKGKPRVKGRTIDQPLTSRRQMRNLRRALHRKVWGRFGCYPTRPVHDHPVVNESVTYDRAGRVTWRVA